MLFSCMRRRQGVTMKSDTDRTKQLIKKAERWVNSEQGKKDIAIALEQSLKAIAEIRHERQIDPTDLNKPITI